MSTKEYKDKISINGLEISVISKGTDNDYISLTDIAKKVNSEDPRYVIQNWMRNKSTIEFLYTWENLFNPAFNRVQFDAVSSEAGTNRFVMTPQKWISSTNAIGVRSKSGRYGGTYAHKDIAFEFASWVSPEFKLYIIKEYQRLKENENSKLSLDWNVKRSLTKVNYKIHTDAIKHYLIPENISPQQKGFTYADEADLLNVALFNMTAKEWRENNSDKPQYENIRDYATIEQLIVLNNLESYNATMIEDNLPQSERLTKLREVAKNQLSSLLTANSSLRHLKD